MDPSLLLGDSESSTPPNGATPALDSSGEEDPAIEQEDPFSLRRRSEYVLISCILRVLFEGLHIK